MTNDQCQSGLYTWSSFSCELLQIALSHLSFCSKFWHFAVKDVRLAKVMKTKIFQGYFAKMFAQ
jgi:hypothetical protein